MRSDVAAGRPDLHVSGHARVLRDYESNEVCKENIDQAVRKKVVNDGLINVSGLAQNLVPKPNSALLGVS